MVNIKDELGNFPLVDLQKMGENRGEIPDNIRNAVVLYNKALESLRMDSEDIAIIGLKKAVSLYPEFYEAINLLGLCYAYIRDYDKAAEMFQRVTKAENNGLKAVNYLKQINASVTGDAGKPADKKLSVLSLVENHTSVKKEKKNSVQTNEIKNAAKSFDNNEQTTGKRSRKSSKATNLGSLSFSRTNPRVSKKKHSWVFAAAIIFLGIITLFIYISFQYAGTTDNESSIQGSTSDYKELEQKYNNLVNEYNKLKKLYEAANIEINNYKVSGKLIDAENLVAARNYEQAADILVQLKAGKLGETEKNKVNQLWGKCIPQACQLVYNQGISLFDSSKFNDAVSKLTKLRTYDSNYKYMNYALYCLGKCYDKLNDSQAAIEAFQSIIDKFPGTDYATWSQNKINEIKSR